MVKIQDKETRKNMLKITWENLNTKFPNWKNNKILKRNKTLKDRYMKSVNKFTYKIYCTILHFV